MNIKERLLNMTAWKAILVIIIALMIGIAVVEEIIVHQVFHFMHNKVDQFANVFDEDDKELESDRARSEKLYNEQQRETAEYMKKRKKAENEERFKSNCKYYRDLQRYKRIVKEAEAHPTDPYRTADFFVERYKERIIELTDYMKTIKKERQFDPVKCEEN